MLDLCSNEILPPVIYELKSLEVINLYSNKNLLRIDDGILQLKNLTSLNYVNCDALVHPPYAVCEKGLEAVRK